MGKRLHSAVKYVVEYGQKSDFNWLSDKVNPIIDILAENDCSHDGDDLRYSDSINANRENLIANIDKIITPDENWEYQEDLEIQIQRIERYGEITRERLYDVLKELIEQSDSNCEVVHFAWY